MPYRLPLRGKQGSVPMTERIDPLLLGLLYNVAQHEPVKITRLPGMISFHDTLADLGLVYFTEGGAVVTEAGWNVIEKNLFPPSSAAMR